LSQGLFPSVFWVHGKMLGKLRVGDRTE
jgi:hypothetical protein